VSQYSLLRDKCLTDEPNACVQPIFGANIFPVIYFFTYVVICLHLMMNLVIAVILDGYEEGKQTPFDQMYSEVCITKWKNFDPNVTLKLPLPRALNFIQEAYKEIRDREMEQDEFEKMFYGRTFDHDEWGQMKDFDIATMPMSWVKCLDLFVSQDNQVGFQSATKQVFRFAVMGSDSNRIREMDDVDSMLDRKTAQKIKNGQRRGQLESQVNLKQEIAVTKLQRAFRQAKRRKTFSQSVPSKKLAGSLAPAAETTGSDDVSPQPQAAAGEGSTPLEEQPDAGKDEVKE